MPGVESETKQKITEDILDLMEKRRQVKNNREKNETLQREIRKKVMKPKRSGSMTSEGTSKYTTEVLIRQCTQKTLKSLEKKNHVHPQDVLSHKTAASL